MDVFQIFELTQSGSDEDVQHAARNEFSINSSSKKESNIWNGQLLVSPIKGGAISTSTIW